MRVRPKRLRYKLRRYGVPVKYVPGWDSARIDPYNGRSDFEGVSGRAALLERGARDGVRVG